MVAVVFPIGSSLGDPQEALKWYKEALSADEEYAPAYFNLGLLYTERLRRPAKAIEAYRQHIILGGGRSAAAREAIKKLQQAGAKAGAEEGG